MRTKEEKIRIVGGWGATVSWFPHALWYDRILVPIKHIEQVDARWVAYYTEPDTGTLDMIWVLELKPDFYVACQYGADGERLDKVYVRFDGDRYEWDHAGLD